MKYVTTSGMAHTIVKDLGSYLKNSKVLSDAMATGFVVMSSDGVLFPVKPAVYIRRPNGDVYDLSGLSEKEVGLALAKTAKTSPMAELFVRGKGSTMYAWEIL
jgi:hypothetical protein